MELESLPQDAVAVPFMRGHYACPDGKIYSTLTGAIKLRKYGRNSCGYATCPVDKKGWLVHITIAKMFLGPKPIDTTVNHKDLDKSNNRADNLEWVSMKEQAAHWRRLKKPVKRYFGKKLIQICEDGREIEHLSVRGAGEAMRLAITEMGGIAPVNAAPGISRAANLGRRAYGYRWKFADDGKRRRIKRG